MFELEHNLVPFDIKAKVVSKPFLVEDTHGVTGIQELVKIQMVINILITIDCILVVAFVVLWPLVTHILVVAFDIKVKVRTLEVAYFVELP